MAKHFIRYWAGYLEFGYCMAYTVYYTDMYIAIIQSLFSTKQHLAIVFSIRSQTFLLMIILYYCLFKKNPLHNSNEELSFFIVKVNGRHWIFFPHYQLGFFSVKMSRLHSVPLRQVEWYFYPSKLMRTLKWGTKKKKHPWSHHPWGSKAWLSHP